MATITTAVYLEDAARTAGETMTINGGSLTVRTDTRWHANSPASMTGSLGAVTISSTLGGSYILDGRDVRWLAYDTGTGNVPAVGTSITQGGVSGYLLGVWSSLTVAPTAVGAAMPASGFLKFREVTSGPFATGALTGIGANATAADVVGWIEVVHDQAIAITVPRLGDFTVRGDWFELDATTGAANQTIQLPTNGSSTTYVPGVWIATTGSPSTDEDWEFYPAIYAAGMSTTNLGTDERSKFVLMGTGGSITIGHNGTTTVGYVPAAGRRVRVPNVFGRQCTTGARATNAIPSATAGTRPDFTTTSAGYIDIENFTNDWYLNFSQPYYVKINHSATFEYVFISECATAFDIYDGGNGISQSVDARTITFTSDFAGGTVQKWKSQRYAAGTTDHSVEVLYSKDITFTNVVSGIITFARSTGMSFQITQSDNINFTNCFSNNQAIQFTTSANCTVTNHDHCDRYVGTTNTTGIYAAYVLATSDAIVFNGFTFGLGGTIANVHPYLGIFNYGQSKNCKFRNIGSRTTALSGGSANNPAYIAASAGNNQNMKFQRIYMTPTRTGAISTTNSDKGILYEHVYGDMADTMTIAALNCEVRNCGGTNTTTGQASVYGTHFTDVFTSDTAGRVVLAMNEPTTETAAYYTAVAGTPKFTSAGGLSMASVNDEVIIEQHYFVKGCTGLPNTAPVVTGTNVTYVSGPDWGNHDIYFQIDLNDGNGWNGSWLDLTGANLNTFDASIDPDLGFKLKYRIVCDTASTTNLISYIRISTTSTLAAQVANLYDLDQYTLTLTGLETGSKVAFLDASTETLRIDVVSESSGSVSYTYPDSDVSDSIDIAILAPGFAYQRISAYTLTAAAASIPITQATDYGYDSGASALCTFNGSTKRVIMDAASTTLNVVGMYSDWVDWALTGNNLAYNALADEVGGNDIDTGAGTSIPVYVFLANSWRIAPDEADHTLAVTTGVVLVSGGGDPFVDTAGAYTVRINYQQPVQAITVSTGGTVAPSASEMRAAMGLAAANLDTQLDALPTAVEIRVEIDANSTALAAIPTNPLLTNDARLDNLDAAVSTRLATAGYTAPDNATITAIAGYTDSIESRLPAALVGGRMDASVGAMAADALTASALAADAGTEIAAAVLSAAQTTPIHSDFRKAIGQDYHGDGSEGDKLRSTLIP